MLPPPPPYTPSRASHGHRSLALFPLPLLFRILEYTLDPRATSNSWISEDEEERARRIWTLHRLRGVCRTFYLISTSILRTRYLPTYLSLIQAGYSSDAYPHDSHPSHFDSTALEIAPDSKAALPSPASADRSVFSTRSRETAVLDRWIAIKVGEELRKLESELSEESGAEREIFARFQPAARIEDLLPLYISPTLISPRFLGPGSPSTTLPLPAPHLSVTLTPGWCQLYIWAKPYGRPGNGRDLVLEVRREKTLEGTARRIGEGLEDMSKGLAEWGGRIL